MLAPSPAKKYPRLSVILNLDRQLPDPWLLDQSKPSRPFPILSSVTSWSWSFGHLLLRLGPAQSTKVCQPSYGADRPPPQTGLQSSSSAAKNISWWTSILHFPLKTNPYSFYTKSINLFLFLLVVASILKGMGCLNFCFIVPVLFLYRHPYSLCSPSLGRGVGPCLETLCQLLDIQYLEEWPPAPLGVGLWPGSPDQFGKKSRESLLVPKWEKAVNCAPQTERDPSAHREILYIYDEIRLFSLPVEFVLIYL